VQANVFDLLPAFLAAQRRPRPTPPAGSWCSKKIIKEGRTRGSLTLKSFEGVVEVGDGKHVVRVIDWGAELEESWRGKRLPRIKIAAKVDSVR